MRRNLLLIFCMVLIYSCVPGNKNEVDDIIDRAEMQLDGLRIRSLEMNAIPRSVDSEHNEIRWIRNQTDWTEGFFPGICWMLYEYNGQEKWKEAAEITQKLIEVHRFDSSSHDLGFMFNNSYGKAYKITGQPKYRTILIDAAKTLVTRYNDSVGCIKSWDWAPERWNFPVIIDNMMNLELLFEVFQLTGDSLFYQIAVSHANTTIRNHFRDDYSSYHVVDYGSDGEVLSRETHQGYSDQSAWSRGQAWGLYGFTLMYRYTGNINYLEQAEHIASYLLSVLPDDHVLPWDTDAPDSLRTYKDASATALLASALIELDSFSETDYLTSARKIISALAEPEYFAENGNNHNYVLKHSVGSLPENSEVDVPLVYADYYFLEALLRLRKLEK